VAARPGSMDDERREARDPLVQGDMVDLDATLGQQLL
jgi:hypothetical protein